MSTKNKQESKFANIPEFYIGDDPKTAKLKPNVFQFKASKSKFGTYINVVNDIGCVLVKAENVKLMWKPGYQYEETAKQVKLTLGVTEEHDWLCRHILEFENAIRQFVIDNNGKKDSNVSVPFIVNTGQQKFITDNCLGSLLPHKRDGNGMGIGINDKQMTIVPQIKNIKLDLVLGPATDDMKLPDYDPVIAATPINQTVELRERGCKIINMDRYERLQNAKAFGKTSQQYIQAKKDWKEFRAIKWTWNTINENIKRGCLLDHVAIQLKGGYIYARKSISITARAKAIYYRESSADGIEEFINFDDIDDEPDSYNVNIAELKKEETVLPTAYQPENDEVSMPKSNDAI